MLTALKARSLGPAVMSGRIAAVALDPADPATFYLGLGSAGIMKTTDAGASFSAVFEREAVAAIGAIAVAPSDSKIVWAGTGEGNDRNSSAWGDGVYRSDDAGATWKKVGLPESRAIPRIVVHPKDSMTAWVAVLGNLWVPSPGRGLWKTTDGGGSWKRVLAAQEPYADRVGCGDVAIDPSNPDVLYAALYARRRTPWSFGFGPEVTDGVDAGGIFKSVDGGATWQKLSKGLPGATGRIGLAVAPKNSRVVYAVVQSHEGGSPGWEVRAKSGGIYRSDDAGSTWTRTSSLNPRPFYFSQIRVDPADDKRIYVLGFMLHVSEDGGITFREDRFKNVHADCHDLAIDARFPRRLVLGTDGGAYQSWNGGEAWSHLASFAAGQYYRIEVDDGSPYRICGGLQDNTNWVGPSRTWSKDGILNSDWTQIGGGDGFYCVFDSQAPNLVYAESQQGEVHRFDLATGEKRTLKPREAEGQQAFRFHWNAPLVAGLHAPGSLYLAGNRVFRLTERGEKWEVISGDLSSRDPDKIASVGSGAETYGTVYTLAESPRQAGLLWAGTDDGRLWISEDDGRTWIDRTGNLPPQARGQWISRIEAGRRDPDVAYLAVSAFRSGNDSPLLWRTGDRGKTWQSIASDLPANGPVKVVREDPSNPALLFVGTEFGLFTSPDRGGHWVRIGGLPTVAVDDLKIHPRERDLVIATHGRSLFVIDDIRALEELTPEVRAAAGHLFPPRPAFGRPLLPGWAENAGSAYFRGENPPEGAMFTVWIREFTGEPAKISVTSAQGQPVANLTVPGTPGLSRVSWDLRPTKDVLTEYGGEGPRFVRPGEYEVQLTVGSVVSKQKLLVSIAEGVETR